MSALTSPSDTAAALPGKIIVGVDGSPQSVGALRYAARLAKSLGARIDAVAAWSEPPVFTPYRVMGIGADVYAEEALTGAIRTAFGEEPPAGLTHRVVRGHPVHVLVTVSDRALMLVVGSRGHGGFVGALLGSVSEGCAEHAHCPVLVHRGGDGGMVS